MSPVLMRHRATGGVGDIIAVWGSMAMRPQWRHCQQRDWVCEGFEVGVGGWLLLLGMGVGSVELWFGFWRCWEGVWMEIGGRLSTEASSMLRRTKGLISAISSDEWNKGHRGTDEK